MHLCEDGALIWCITKFISGGPTGGSDHEDMILHYTVKAVKVTY